MPGKNKTQKMENNAMNRRPVPARVHQVQELRRSGAAGRHADQRRKASRNGCRGKGRNAAIREQLV